MQMSGAGAASVEKRLHLWKEEKLVSRMWGKDPTLWSAEASPREISDRLGWLYLPESMKSLLPDINAFAEEIRNGDYRHVVVLGMGGSSLAPAVFQDVFGNSRGYPGLSVLDSTHPRAIRSLSERIEPRRTLFLVSSKSGTTLETTTLFCHFWSLVGRQSQEPGRHFVAITDAGTPLEQEAKDRGFLRTFIAPSDVGGRYAALTVFGLVPAALIGIDAGRLLDQARQMAEACAPRTDPAQNPGIELGAALGEFWLAGRDKITFVTDARLASFPLWLEQLIAESTGKNGKGLVPIAGEIPGPPEVYGQDRLFVGLSMSGSERLEALEALQSAGYPVLRIALNEPADLGREFFRWEIAVASAGSILGIHPFDQPDVQLAKDLARNAMESKGQKDRVPEGMLSIDRNRETSRALADLLKESRPGDYVAIQAYLEPAPGTTAAIERLRHCMRDRLHIATTVGFGPRFLHSTGQLHKGGPETGIFIQLTDQIVEDLMVPEKAYTFGTLLRAQAEGDYQALKQRGRRILRLDLGKDAEAGLAELATLLDAAELQQR